MYVCTAISLSFHGMHICHKCRCFVLTSLEDQRIKVSCKLTVGSIFSDGRYVVLSAKNN